jgi:ZIP family zinc transporter
MVAASFWSLLAPGIEMSEGEGFVKVIPAAIGFALGALFIFGLDKILPHLHINFKEAEGIKTPWHRTTLLTLAITLHNIPEGLAIGVLFGAIDLEAGYYQSRGDDSLVCATRRTEISI